MARPPAYRLYSGCLATMHASNDLQMLIEIGKLHGVVLKKKQTVKDTYGNVVWEGDKDGKA